MNLAGKTREQIKRALVGKSTSELIEIIVSLSSVEQLFTAPEIARRSKMNVRDVRKAINAGKFHDPIFGPGFFVRGGNSKKVSAGAVLSWRRSLFVPVSARKIEETGV